ncbi:MAG: O-antigen ligase family protein [Bacteroidia bacterium]
MTTDTGYEIPTYFITRMSSLLLTPVLFGTIMALSCTYYYYKISYYEFYWFNYVTFILLFLCLLLSVSRGALISFLAASAFISVSVVHRKVKLIGGLIFTMLIVLVFTSFYATNSLKLVQWICHSSVETANMQAGVTRVNRWQVSLLDFKNQPQGYGFGKTGAVAYRYFINSPSIPAARYTTDGWYLKTACETGVYGLLSYLILAGTFLFYTLKKVIKNKSPNLIFTLGIFFVINIQNIASNTLDFYPYIIVYWLIIGFSINERSVVVAND